MIKEHENVKTEKTEKTWATIQVFSDTRTRYGSPMYLDVVVKGFVVEVADLRVQVGPAIEKRINQRMKRIQKLREDLTLAETEIDELQSILHGLGPEYK